MIEGQADDDFRKRESEFEDGWRCVGSPSTNVKSEPKESLGAFHSNESIQAVSPNTSLVCWVKSRLVRAALEGADKDDQWLMALSMGGGNKVGYVAGCEGNNAPAELLPRAPKSRDA